MLELALAQQVVQRGAVEDAVADLLEEGAVGGRDERLDEVGRAPVERALDDVVARGGEVAQVVVDVDELDASSSRARAISSRSGSSASAALSASTSASSWS